MFIAEFALIALSSLLAAPGADWTVADITPEDDARTTRVRDTNSVYTMGHFGSLDEWEAYAETLRRKMLVSSGLWPLPDRTPLNPQVEEAVGYDDYSVSKVRFEAYPGFLVTGNLYRPVGDGPFPAVICPHGHWSGGRLEDGERGSVPARAITFARMGIVAFTYDMIGYNDSLQFSRNWAHSWDSVPLAERQRQHLWGIHPFGLHLWSSIRALDFVRGLPYVDADRLGCTGASGGGTQTFALSAVDRRVQVAAPVNMISHTMQGGCVCENAPIIRLDASNMEIGALFAPKPLLMVSATGDWTKATIEVEYPAVRSIYALYGAADHVSSVRFDAPHNFNLDSREAVYRHFGKWLLKQPEKYRSYAEPAYELPEPKEMRVFPDDRLPDGVPTGDAVIASRVEAIRQKWRDALPETYTEALPFRQEHRGAFADVFGADPDDLPLADGRRLRTVEHTAYTVEHFVLDVRGSGGAIPALVFTPPDADERFPVLIVHGSGKAALQAEFGGPGGLVDALLKDGRTVVAIDPFLTGQMAGERKTGAYPDTFVPSTTAYRVQDIVAAARWIRERTGDHSVDLIGLGEAGLWTIFAAALDHGIARTVADLNGFNPDSDAEWVARHYVPCIRSIGGLETAACFVAPRGLWVMNAAENYDSKPLLKVFSDTGSKAFIATAGRANHETIVEALD